jgi:hypothetical protein
MRRRVTATLAALTLAGISLALPTRAATAQDQTLRVLKTVGTPEEKPQIDSAVNRLRARLKTDVAFQTRLNEALAKRDMTTARSLVATTVHLRTESVVIGLPSKTSRLDVRRDRYFRLASARFNPWYAIVITKSTAFCIGLFKSGADECRSALRAMGYTPTS